MGQFIKIRVNFKWDKFEEILKCEFDRIERWEASKVKKLYMTTIVHEEILSFVYPLFF